MADLTQIELSDAASRSWDVIIAGSSFAGMFFLHGLPENLDILILEKGLIHSREAQLAGSDPSVDSLSIVNYSSREKTFVSRTMFGGNSNCWTGQVPRFLPSDFTLFEDTGRSAPWPIGYEDIAPYYDEVEALMEAAGSSENAPAPRTGAYPFPAHVPSRSDMVCIEQRPDIWQPSPSARSNGGSRPTCCANYVCALCPIDAKFTIQNSLDAFVRDRTHLVSGTGVEAVEIGSRGAESVIVRDAGGATHRLRAGVIALGTNAINNPAILMRSGLRMPALGSYLHEQVGSFLGLDISNPSRFAGTVIAALCYGFWIDADRSARGAAVIESVNVSTRIRPEPGRWTDHTLLKIVAEDEPRAENAVVLDRDGKAVIHWHGHSEYAYDGIRHAARHIADVLPFKVERRFPSEPEVSEYHIQGTHRMGTDDATSVVDDTCRVHGIPNLFVLGAGVFPTCSPANPTLTISALSLRAGRSV